MSRSKTISLILVIAIVLLVIANLAFGSVKIPFNEVFGILSGNEPSKDSWRIIVIESRLPQSLTALLCGMALAVSGLILQTAFRNPLAGPDILGVNSGAGLGVALVMLFFGGNLSAGSVTLGSSISVIIGAFIGALLIMGLILLLSGKLKNNIMLLIAGIMISFITSSIISLLNFFSTAEGVHSYAMWGMGNFGGVTRSQLPLFSIITIIGLIIAVILIKPLNALLLGDYYAENLGINIKKTRTWLLLSTGLLVAVTTAYCGPISFLGLAVPHLARLLLKSNNHRSLMPVTILTGASIALICNLISSLTGDKGLIPLNAITPIVGAPIIIYVLIKNSRSFR